MSRISRLASEFHVRRKFAPSLGVTCSHRKNACATSSSDCVRALRYAAAVWRTLCVNSLKWPRNPRQVYFHRQNESKPSFWNNGRKGKLFENDARLLFLLSNAWKQGCKGFPVILRGYLLDRIALCLQCMHLLEHVTIAMITFVRGGEWCLL